MDTNGPLSQLASAGRPRGRKPADHSFYTYSARGARGNSTPPGLPGPRAAPVRPPNNASGSPLAAAAAHSRPGPAPVGAAEGGVRGPGTGRSDEIDARLSDGEYVIDAETVALLGDGSTEAGVRRLDQMREKLRSHKGRALAKGKFSPDAKAPEQYLGKE